MQNHERDDTRVEQQSPPGTPSPGSCAERAIDPFSVSAILFLRYERIIRDAIECGEDSPGDDPRLSLGNLFWMCRTGLTEGITWPIDKTSRWLGFVQGCLAMRGLISVDAERDFSRPLFHAAYAAQGLAPPATQDRTDDGPAW